MIDKILAPVLALAILGACGGGGDPAPFVEGVTPLDEGAVRNTDGSFTVTTDSRVIELPATGTANGQPFWFAGSLIGGAFESDDVLVVAGSSAGTPFAELTGTPGALSGSADFVGRYSASSAGSFRNGELEVGYDFAAQTLMTTSGDLNVDGTVGAGGAISGTVTFEGSEADFEGGFFGGDTVAGAFQNDTLGGLFYGTR